MISPFPTLFETIVLPIKATEVEERLQSGVQRHQLFGRLNDRQFQLTAKVVRPTQFQPVLKGTIESTSRGSIVFLRYQLLRSTRFYLTFWCGILLLVSALVGWNKQNLLYSAISLFMVIAVWWIAKSNLTLQSALARKVLLDLLS